MSLLYYKFAVISTVLSKYRKLLPGGYKNAPPVHRWGERKGRGLFQQFFTHAQDFRSNPIAFLPGDVVI